MIFYYIEILRHILKHVNLYPFGVTKDTAE